MRLYYEIAKRSFRRATTYRSAYIAGIITNAFFGAVRSFVFIALYAAGGDTSNFTLDHAISYTWITQALISIGGAWVGSMELSASIRSGDVVTDLARPWNFYGYWLSRGLGERIFNLPVRGTLTYLIGILYFRAYVPSVTQLLGFCAAIILAILISIAFSFIVNMTAFWLLDSTGVMMLANILLGFFSGFMIPLELLPPEFVSIARLLPFQAITALPAAIFLGRVSGPELWGSILLQCFWAIIMTLAALLVLRAAVRKVIVQGG